MLEKSSVLLHVRCGGCGKLYQRSVELPAVSAPTEGEELMEFPEVREMRFSCPSCEAPFGEIVAFKAIENKNEKAA